MDLQDRAGPQERFRAYAAGITSVLGHADRVRPFEDYCVGLLSAEGRKSVEPLQTRARAPLLLYQYRFRTRASVTRTASAKCVAPRRIFSRAAERNRTCFYSIVTLRRLRARPSPARHRANQRIHKMNRRTVAASFAPDTRSLRKPIADMIACGRKEGH